MTFAKNKNMQCYAVFMNLHFRTSNTLGIVPCDLGTQSLKSGIPLFKSPSTWISEHFLCSFNKLQQVSYNFQKWLEL